MVPDERERPAWATIEELDAPPPAADGARALRWERLAGLLLVLGLAGFGLWQWAGQQSRADHYRAGSAAVAALDWDAACAAFGAAGDYSDAPAHRANACGNAATRDRQYARASAAAGRGDWVAVLQALLPLQSLAPHYRDVAALESRALAAAATAALSGTVALRLQADPPGLYRFAAGGWRALPDSDGASRVRALCPGGGVLYDVPVRAGAGPPVPAPLGRFDAQAAGWADAPREFRVDAPGGGPAARFAVDPDRNAQYTCTAGGVWTIHYAGVPWPGNSIRRLDALDVLYQGVGDPAPRTPALPGPDWYVAAVAPAAGTLLLLDTTGLADEGGPTRLYLANFDGSGRRLLIERPGTPQAVTLSPDGRYALLRLGAAQPAERSVVYTVLLLDTGAGPAAVLHTLTVTQFSFNAPAPITARFLQQAPRSDQALLIWQDGAHQVIRLVDPRHPDPPLLDTRVSGPWERLTPAALDPATGTLFVLGVPFDSDSPASGVAISGDNASHALTLDAPAVPVAWVRGGYLLTLTSPAGAGSSGGFVLRSAPLGASGAVPGPSRALLSRAEDIGADPVVPFRLAPNWLVYRGADGMLHGRSYDGTLDMPLPWAASGFPIFDLLAPP